MGLIPTLITFATRLNYASGIRLNRVLPRRFKTRLLRKADATIPYSLCGHNIQIPVSHALRSILAVYPQYDMNLGRIAQYVSSKYADATAIDIGANIGDTATIISRFAAMPVLCVEGNDLFLPVLKENIAGLAPACDVEECFVGREDGSLQCAVNTVSGTASLTTKSGATRTIKFHTLESIVRRHPNYAQPRLLKIDTDGYDCEIIRYSRTFLSQHRPVVYFEFDPFFMKNKEEDAVGVFDALKECGYRRLAFFNSLGDYLLSARLTDDELLEDLRQFVAGRGSKSYWDICAFHDQDDDISRMARLKEIQFFRQFRQSDPSAIEPH